MNQMCCRSPSPHGADRARTDDPHLLVDEEPDHGAGDGPSGAHAIRHTQTDQGAAEAQEAHRLAVRPLARHTAQHRLDARRRRLPDRAREVLIRLEPGKVEEGIGAQRPAQRLLRAHVEGDDARAERLRVLDGEVAEPAAGAADEDEVAGTGLGPLERRVDRDAGAHERRRPGEVDAVRDGRHVLGRADEVLLEGAGVVVSRDFGRRAARLAADETVV